MNNINFSENKDSISKQIDIESVLIYGDPDAIQNAELTICIPTFKRPEYLEKAIRSSLNQTTSIPYRIIIVDNDPDFTNNAILDLIKKFNDKRLVYYKNKKNLLLFGNLNRSILLAKSRWVALLHDDDELLNNYVDIISKILNKYGDRINAISNSFTVQDDRTEVSSNKRSIIEQILKIIFSAIKKAIIQLKQIIRIPLSSNLFLGNVYGAPTCGMIFKREIFLQSGGFNEDYFPASDWFFLIYFSYKYKFYKYRLPISIYRFAVNTSIKKEVIEKYKNTKKQCYFSLKKYSFVCRFWLFFLQKDFSVIMKNEKKRLSVFYWIVRHIYVLLYH
jgi:glycosyltransferase involved in cell wall biosynthesis